MDFVGNWQFHPKPLTKPVTISEALQGIIPSERRMLSPLYQQYWRATLPGEAMGKSIADRIANPNRPANTLRKCGNIARWDEPRWLAVNEYALLASFPESFKWIGVRTALERIGNSVPPNLMRAIAANIRLAPFMQDIEHPTVISTFAGCGGSTLGYRLAGYKELLAVEWDNNAVATFKLNFPGVPIYHGDICKLPSNECMRLAGIKAGELDVLDGSPPCQSFSVIGQRKFNDSRSGLFREYARLLRDLQPKVFVMENVVGMIKGYMKQAYLKIASELRACGYVVKGQVLNAMYYGVPQSRERVIIVGVREDLFALC